MLATIHVQRTMNISTAIILKVLILPRDSVTALCALDQCIYSLGGVRRFDEGQAKSDI